MKFRAIRIAAVAAVTLATAASSYASAASVTEPSRWFVAGAGLTEGQTKEVACAVGTHKEKKQLTLNVSFDEGATPIELTATGVKCTRHEGELGGNSQIAQTVSETNYAAESFGRLTLTGVTVSTPAACKVGSVGKAAEATILTNPLKGELFMDTANGEITFEKLEPTPSAEGILAEIKLEKSGALTCPVSGTYNLRGTIFGEAVQAEPGNEATTTGTSQAPHESVTQALTFSAEIQSTAGGGNLSFGGNAASLSGRINDELTGANAGQAWGARPPTITPETTHWIIAGAKMATAGSETVKCEVGKHLFGEKQEAKLVLTATIFGPVEFAATGIECLNNAGTEAGKAKITQTATMAEDEGRLRFTGVTVVSPPNCRVKGISIADPVGTITTNELKSQLQEETVGGVITVFDKFEPKAAGGAFAEIKVEKSGELSCAVSGNYSIKGSSFGEAVKNVEATEPAPTGFEGVTQALTFSKGIEETAGGTLTLGGNKATLTGRVLNKLTGANAGKAWGAVK